MRETLVNNFLRISKIPRESGHEEKIADFFIQVAKENNLYSFKDENNNVLIKKKGNINAKPIALQAHLDMVCVKTKESNHNFNSDEIEVIIDNDKVFAKDTTLGADQGVGLAMMLTIIEDKTLNHPNLEFFFTTEEETTFHGADTFPYSKVNSKRLINLDADKDDIVVIASDGDILNEYSFKGHLIQNDFPSFKVLIDGFIGGNSGCNIELSKDNAISTMAKILKGKNIYLKSINGGTTENDLATYCEVILNTPEDIDIIFEGVNAKINTIDNHQCFSKEDTENIINEILELKCGFLSQSNSSANLGLINTNNNEIKIYYIFRSLDENELEKINRKSIELDNNFRVNKIYSDSIWRINKESKLLKKYKDIYYEEFKEYPKEEVCHGGTECSSIKSRIEEVDIISIGANIEKIHTYEEVTYISSWLKTYHLLIKLLESMD